MKYLANGLKNVSHRNFCYIKHLETSFDVTLVVFRAIGPKVAITIDKFLDQTVKPSRQRLTKELKFHEFCFGSFCKFRNKISLILKDGQISRFTIIRIFLSMLITFKISNYIASFTEITREHVETLLLS